MQRVIFHYFLKQYTIIVQLVDYSDEVYIYLFAEIIASYR